MWFEPLPPVPAVDLVRKLKQIPLFRFASVDELFRIATISRQVRYGEGTKVQERGSPAEYLQVLMQGSFRVENGGPREESLLAPPAMLGLQEVLKGIPIQTSAVAETQAVALVMPADELQALLAANIELTQGLFRMLLDPSGNDHPLSAIAGLETFRQERGEPLRTLEKVMALQTIPVLAHATAEEIYELAAVTREIPLPEGATLFSAGAPASILLVLTGEIELSSPATDPVVVGPRSCLGVHQTLAGASWSETARVVGAGRALQTEHEPFFELLADRMNLLQGIFSAVFHRGGDPGSGSR